MMPLETSVICQHFSRRQQKRRAPRGSESMVAIEEHGRKSNAIVAEPPPQSMVDRPCRAGLTGNHEVASVGHQFLDFRNHAGSKAGITAPERDHHRMRVLTEPPEDELFQTLLQRNSRIVASPAVPSFLSGCAMYWTTTRRAGICAPHDIVFSPWVIPSFPVSRTASCVVFPSSVTITSLASLPRQSKRCKTPSTSAFPVTSSIQTVAVGIGAPFGFICLRAASSAAWISARLA